MENKGYYQVEPVELPEGKKAYFASDVHLGLYPPEKSREREIRFVQWLDSIKEDVGILFLAGDIFDYWYEYKKVTGRGFVRFLGKLCEITDRGIPVYFFTGNHDVWVFDYLPAETGVKVFRNPIEIRINHHRFFIGHGDGLGPGDSSYKLLRKIFHNKILQFLFSRLHPNFTYMLGHTWSRHSRYSKGLYETFLGTEKEFNVLFAKEYLKNHQVDYFVFGHRHIPMDIEFSDKARLINLGEWIHACTFGVYDGESMKLNWFDPESTGRNVDVIRCRIELL